MSQDTNNPRQKREAILFWIAVLSVVLTAAGVLFPIIFAPKYEITATTRFKENLLIVKIENSGDYSINGSSTEKIEQLQLIQNNRKFPIKIPDIFNPKDYLELEFPKYSKNNKELIITGKIKNISPQNIKIISSDDIFVWKNLSEILYKTFLFFTTIAIFFLILILGYSFAFPYQGTSNQNLRSECFKDILNEMNGRKDYIEPFHIFYALYNWANSASISSFRSWALKNKCYFFDNLHLYENEYYFYLKIEQAEPHRKHSYIEALKKSDFSNKLNSDESEFDELLNQTMEFEAALIRAFKKNKKKFKWCGALWNNVEENAKKI